MYKRIVLTQNYTTIMSNHRNFPKTSKVHETAYGLVYFPNPISTTENPRITIKFRFEKHQPQVKYSINLIKSVCFQNKQCFVGNSIIRGGFLLPTWSILIDSTVFIYINSFNKYHLVHLLPLVIWDTKQIRRRRKSLRKKIKSFSYLSFNSHGVLIKFIRV